jgi:membrane-associated protein
VVVVGDIVGDIMYYAHGYYGRQRFVKPWGRFLGITLERVERLGKHFEKHSGKILIIGNLSQGVGALVLVAAGIARVPFQKFFRYNFIPTLPKSLIRLLIGYYSGKVILKLVHTSTKRRLEQLWQPSYVYCNLLYNEKW